MVELFHDHTFLQKIFYNMIVCDNLLSFPNKIGL